MDLPGDGERVHSGRPFGGRKRDLLPRAFRRDLLPRAFRRDLLPRAFRRDLLPRAFRRDMLPRAFRRDMLPRAFRRDRFVRWLAVRAEVGFLVDAADFALIDRDPRVDADGCGFGLGGRLGHARLLHGTQAPGFLLALALDRVGHARGILPGAGPASGERGVCSLGRQSLARLARRVRHGRLRIVDRGERRVGRHRLPRADGVVEHGEQGHGGLVDDPPFRVAERAHLGHDPLVEGAAHGGAAQPSGPRIPYLAIGVDHVQQALSVPADLSFCVALARVGRRIAEAAQGVGRSRRKARGKMTRR